MSVSTSPALPSRSTITYSETPQPPSVTMKWNGEVGKYFAHVIHGHCSNFDVAVDLGGMRISQNAWNRVKNYLDELETCILDLTLMKEAAASSQPLSKELTAAINTAIESDKQMKALILARITSH